MIYVDHSATTPLFPEVLEAMLPYFSVHAENADAVYRPAVLAKHAVADARKRIADLLGATPAEIIFTSGGTESNCLAIRGCPTTRLRKRILVSEIEHASVLAPSALCKAEHLSVTKKGVIDLAQAEQQIHADTALLSCMYVNNELGTVQPIRALAELAHDAGAIMHTDAVGAIGHLPVLVSDLGVDLLSASAHKFGGPKGVGFLYVKRGISLTPMILGGGQEYGLRSGTTPVAQIVGMAKAMEISCANISAYQAHTEALKQRFLTQLKQTAIDFRINGDAGSATGILNLSFSAQESDTIVHALDLYGICASSGAACNSHTAEPSHVIRAIDTPPPYQTGAVRFSFGCANTNDEIDQIVHALQRILCKHNT